jgi:ribosome biogenesis GTPase
MMTFNLTEGVVIRSTGSWYIVYTDNGETIHCRLRGHYRILGIRTTNPVAVGDRVSIQPEPERNTAVIIHIHERHNFIIRKATKLSKSAHIIAANLDQAVLVATIDQPRTSTGFIDRFLVTAEAYHIPAVIVFNKIDLYDDMQLQALEQLKKVYKDAGYGVLCVSALKGDNMEAFELLLKDKISLLAGHSGVGKSALINTIDSSLKLRTGEISSVHNKGKHTTTFAEMHQLDCGGWIVDTPGIKEFGLHNFESETLAQRFPEMRQRMTECRFANCTHLHEPGCAVKEAVENGTIATSRYHNYINMMSNDFTHEYERT